MRHKTVTQLRRHLNAVLLKSPGQALGLWGEAGLGKSHTVRELLAETPCRHLIAPSTVTWSELVRQLPRPTGLPGWARTRLETLLRHPELEVQGFEDTLAVMLGGLAPFVLHFEDLHEASPERQGFFERLARIVPRVRGVALSVSSRVAPPAAFRAYRLEPLDRGASDALLEAQASPLPPEGLEWVYRRAGGNALFTLEFWRYLLRQGAFWSDGQRWQWRKPADDFVPVSIEALIEVMLDQQTDAASRPALEALAVLEGVAPNVDDAAWAHVAALEPTALHQTARRLEGSGLLLQGRFSHPLFREVLRREVPPERLSLYARRAVAFFETAHPDIAAEFIGAASLEADAALGLLEAARQRAEQNADFGGVARWLAAIVRYLPFDQRAARALEAARTAISFDVARAEQLVQIAVASPGAPSEVFLVQAEIWARLGQVQRALDTLAQFAAREEVALLYLQTLLFVKHIQGHSEELLRLWHEHPRLQDAVDTYTMSNVCFAHVRLNQLEAAEALVERMFARNDTDLRSRYYAWNLRGVTAMARDDYARGLEAVQVTLELARQGRNPSLIWQGLRNGAVALRALSRIDEAFVYLQQAVNLAVQLGNPRQMARTQDSLASLLFDQGRFEEAETLYRDVQAMYALYDTLPEHCDNLLDQTQLYLDWQPTSGVPLALKHARTALRQARSLGAVHFLARALALTAQAEALSRHPEKALGFAQELLELARAHPVESPRALFSFGFALEASGEPAEARDAFLKAQTEYARAGHEIEAHRAGLEADRLSADLPGARRRHALFLEQGLLREARVVRRYFPAVSTEAASIEASAASPEPALRLSVLGLPQLERDGSALVYRGKKRLELLCYLLEARIAGKSEVSALELAEVFYPDASDREAKHTLRQQVYLIRADLGQQCIHSTTNGYALAEVSSDAEAFLATGDTALWRGAYLERASEGWDGNVRESLAQALRSSLERLLDQDAAEATRIGLILLEMDPYDLELLRGVLLAQRRSGDERGLTRLYKRAVERFWDLGEDLPSSAEAFLGMPPASQSSPAQGTASAALGR